MPCGDGCTKLGQTRPMPLRQKKDTYGQRESVQNGQDARHFEYSR